MKKYKLLVDLSTFKKGEIFELREKGLYKLKSKNEDKEILAYLTKTVNDFGILEKEKGFFEEIREKNIYNLRRGDEFYILLNTGSIYLTNWGNTSIDEDILYTNNAFLTKEEAEKELMKRQAIQRIKKYCWKNGIETDYKKIENGKFCYLLVYDFLNDRLSVARISEVNIFYSPIGYFSEENAEKILEKFENDLKIIFDV